jgi:hyperosmotically inducible protein
MRQSTLVSATITLFVLLIGVGACGKTIAETIDDATITTRVKAALLNDPDVGALRIVVDTSRGVVTLSGAIKTRAEESKAIQLARRTPGVMDVKSRLQVQGSSD